MLSPMMWGMSKAPLRFDTEIILTLMEIISKYSVNNCWPSKCIRCNNPATEGRMTICWIWFLTCESDRCSCYLPKAQPTWFPTSADSFPSLPSEVTWANLYCHMWGRRGQRRHISVVLSWWASETPEVLLKLVGKTQGRVIIDADCLNYLGRGHYRLHETFFIAFIWDFFGKVFFSGVFSFFFWFKQILLKRFFQNILLS